MSSEILLQESCNLVIRGTHFPWRAPWGERDVYVVDKDTFSAMNSMTQAKDQAIESIEAEGGCKTCPLKSRCNPRPTMISNYPDRNSISSAVLTNFE